MGKERAALRSASIARASSVRAMPRNVPLSCTAPAMSGPPLTAAILRRALRWRRKRRDEKCPAIDFAGDFFAQRQRARFCPRIWTAPLAVDRFGRGTGTANRRGALLPGRPPPTFPFDARRGTIPSVAAQKQKAPRPIGGNHDHRAAGPHRIGLRPAEGGRRKKASGVRAEGAAGRARRAARHHPEAPGRDRRGTRRRLRQAGDRGDPDRNPAGAAGDPPHLGAPEEMDEAALGFADAGDAGHRLAHPPRSARGLPDHLAVELSVQPGARAAGVVRRRRQQRRPEAVGDDAGHLGADRQHCRGGVLARPGDGHRGRQGGLDRARRCPSTTFSSPAAQRSARSSWKRRRRTSPP